MYEENEPKHVKAEKVRGVVGRLVDIFVEGEEFKNIASKDERNSFNTSFVKVRHSRKGWFHVWFRDEDVE